MPQEGDNYGYEDRAASASHDREQEPSGALAPARDAPRHKTNTARPADIQVTLYTTVE